MLSIFIYSLKFKMGAIVNGKQLNDCWRRDIAVGYVLSFLVVSVNIYSANSIFDGGRVINAGHLQIFIKIQDGLRQNTTNLTWAE